MEFGHIIIKEKIGFDRANTRHYLSPHENGPKKAPQVGRDERGAQQPCGAINGLIIFGLFDFNMGVRPTFPTHSTRSLAINQAENHLHLPVSRYCHQ
jgi:hypothetical protein